MDEFVGFTTTIPIEIVFAAGFKPIDLNNLFITDDTPQRYIEIAESDGFPRNMCSWVKGIYGVILEKKIRRVIVVMEGDCTNTRALSEILKHKGFDVIPFAYPYDRDKEILKREIDKLASFFSVDKERLREVEKEIEDVRKTLYEIDRFTWEGNLISGYENHLWLVGSSDMEGDYRSYLKKSRDFLEKAKKRKKIEGIRLGYIGVPPIIKDIYEIFESLGAHIVFNEIQRQFSLPFFNLPIVERYYLYTYPYGLFVRLEDIKREIKIRKIKGVIHNVQSFCFRIMEDIILRDLVDVPIITIEGELPKSVDSRTKTRIEAFMEMLKWRESEDST